MNHRLVLKQAWYSTRSRSMLGLSAVSAAANAVAGLMALSLVILIASALAALVSVALGAPAVFWYTHVPEGAQEALDAVIALNTPATIACVALFVALVGIAAFDVAARAGMIIVADKQRMGQDASPRRGLAVGWSRWLRFAALSAISVYPALLVVFAHSVTLWVFVQRIGDIGPTEAAAGMLLGVQALRPLAALVELASIPLSVIVLLSLRFAALDDLEWRQALRAAWHMCKCNLASVLTMFGLLFAIGIGVSVIAAFVALVIGAAGVGVMYGLGVFGRPDSVVIGLLATAATTVLVLAALSAPVVAFTSAAWTGMWRLLRESDHADEAVG